MVETLGPLLLYQAYMSAALKIPRSPCADDGCVLLDAESLFFLRDGGVQTHRGSSGELLQELKLPGKTPEKY